MEIKHAGQNDESKLRTCILFKQYFKFERYLEVVKKNEIRITRLCISTDSLYIETGRHKRRTKFLFTKDYVITVTK